MGGAALARTTSRRGVGRLEIILLFLCLNA
jgi:hypothetical protein